MERERNGRLGEDERRRGIPEKYGARNSKNIAGDIRRKGAPRTRHGKEEGRKEVWHGSLALSGRHTARGARVRVSRLVHAPSKSMCTRAAQHVRALTALSHTHARRRSRLRTFAADAVACIYISVCVCVYEAALVHARAYIYS